MSDLARINKSTFYRHYADICSLSEEIENDLIQNCIDTIADANRILEKDGILLLSEALGSQGSLYNIIFSGSRKDAAINKVHDYLMEKILMQHPEYDNNIEKKVMLTTLIYGTSRAYFIYKDIDMDILVNSLVKLNQALQ